VLAVKGTIVPSTLQDVTLVASINGRSVEGESKIPQQNAPISQRVLETRRRSGETPKRAGILNAELIVIAPGSLYTSILPTCLWKMVEADQGIASLKVLVCNLASQQGETDGLRRHRLSTRDHEHVGSNLFDFVSSTPTMPTCRRAARHRSSSGQRTAVQHPEVFCDFIARMSSTFAWPPITTPTSSPHDHGGKVWQA